MGNTNPPQKTINGGATWTNTASAGSSVKRGIAVADASTVVLVGDGGSIRKTVDGGASWTAPASGTTNRLWDVDQEAANLIAVGDGGTIVTSADGGDTWTLRVSGTALSLYGVAFGDASTAYAVGDDGTILKSADAGVTWSAQSYATTEDLQDVTAVSATWAFAAGTNAFALKATDGASWSPVNLGAGFNRRVDGVDAVDERILYAVSWERVLRSFDGGATWTVDTVSGFENAGVGIAAPRVDAVWAVGADASWNGRIRKLTMGSPISDYAGGTTDWTTANTHLFGACLRAVSGAGVTGAWTVDGNNDCTAVDTDPWYPIVATTGTAGSKVAASTTSGTTAATANLRFGLRTRSDQPPGTYIAPIVLEVVAPNL